MKKSSWRCLSARDNSCDNEGIDVAPDEIEDAGGPAELLSKSCSVSICIGSRLDFTLVCIAGSLVSLAFPLFVVFSGDLGFLL